MFNPRVAIITIKNFFLRKNLPPPKKIFKILLFTLFVALLFLKINKTLVFRRFVMHREFDGDERKYLRMVHSLEKDGDLDLSDLFGFKEEMEKIKNEILSSGSHMYADLYVIGVNRGIYCLHMPGVAFFILPAYMLDSTLYPNDPKRAPYNLFFLPLKLYFTRLWLAAIAVLSMFLFFRLLNHLFHSLLLVTFLFLLFILNSPFPHYSFTVFPGCLAIFFSLLTLSAIFYPFRNRWLNDFFIIIGISYLPWLHQRFFPLSLGLFLALLFYRKEARINSKRIFIICLMLVVLSLPYFYYFYSISGNPSPLSTSKLLGRVHAQTSFIPVGFFGLLFSHNQGNIWKYPWIILFFFGIYWGFKKQWKLAFALLLIFIPYYLICSAGTPLGGGSLPPGRFLLPLFPLFLIFAGNTLQDLSKKFSYPKLFFYLIIFLLIFLNNEIWHIYF